MEDLTPNIVYGPPGGMEGLAPDEQEEMALTARLGEVSPSQEDQAYVRRVNYGRNNVREQMDRGQIPPDLGQIMLQQMNSRVEPLMVRAREVPIIMARLNYVRMQRQMAMQEAIFHQNMAFRARSIEDRVREFGEGENAYTTIEQPDGKLTIVNGHLRRAAQPGSPGWEEQQRQRVAAQVARESRDFARRQYDSWRRDFVTREGKQPTLEESNAFMEQLETSMTEFNRRFGPPATTISSEGPTAAAVGSVEALAADIQTPRPFAAPRPTTTVPPLPEGLRSTIAAAMEKTPLSPLSPGPAFEVQMAARTVQNLHAAMARQGGSLTRAQAEQMLDAMDVLERRARATVAAPAATAPRSTTPEVRPARPSPLHPPGGITRF